MSNALSFYIILIVAINILGCVALLFFTRKKKQSGEKGKTTGHVYDGIEEYDNPMPRWWLWLFYITIVFAVIYLILYPGLGKFKGVLGWSQIGQYEEEVAEADAKYMPLFEKYAAMSVKDLQNEPEALQMGQSIFANTCFGCHGADGRGGIGFPNLTDDDWLYGGTPEDIMYSIMEGRKGAMPAWGGALGEEGVSQVVHYILSENEVERTFKPGLVDEGKTKYEAMCAVCHGKDLSGNTAMGAPNLKDTTWLHGGSISMIKDVIENGIQANMPAHDKILGEEKAHLVTAYVYSLSHADDEQNQQ